MSEHPPGKEVTREDFEILASEVQEAKTRKFEHTGNLRPEVIPRIIASAGDAGVHTETLIDSKEEKYYRIIKSIDEKLAYAEHHLGDKKKWIVLGGVLAIGAIKGYELHKDIEEQKRFASEYAEYLEQEMSTTDREVFESTKKHLVETFGEAVVQDIVLADQTAFRHRNDRETDIVYEGFKEKEGDAFKEGELTAIKEHTFTENYLNFPKDWVNGELSRIVFTKGGIEGKNGGTRLGMFASSTSFDKGMVLVYDLSAEISPEQHHYYSIQLQESFSHEIGHANDWEASSKLNLQDRVELLAQIEQRMTSPDALKGVTPLDEKGTEYWQSYLDGTPEGRYAAAREYWAEICGEYFNYPKKLREASPEDFALVDEYVKRTDPSFDILDPQRGRYNPYTGELNERWKDQASR